MMPPKLCTKKMIGVSFCSTDVSPDEFKPKSKSKGGLSKEVQGSLGCAGNTRILVLLFSNNREQVV